MVSSTGSLEKFESMLVHVACFNKILPAEYLINNRLISDNCRGHGIQIKVATE